MKTHDLKALETQAVDLDQARAAKEATDEARLASAQRAAESQIAKWDKAMTRAFKGIVGRSERRRRLQKAADRAV